MDMLVATVVGSMHVLCLFAPFTFSWTNFGLMMGLYFLTGCVGITMGYHRLFSHRSYKVPKWLEYFIAYCGAQALQGDPMDWVSSHRWHHYHTDDPLDPHSPYEGFWWSHSGWFFDAKSTLKRVGDRSNVSDMAVDPFYRHLEKWYGVHIALLFGLLYLIGGFPAIVWGGAVRLVWVYHITWLVNSAAHCWGY